MSLLEVDGVQKIYTTRFGGAQVQALSHVTFSVEEGEYVAIMGESGSGKTTLLNILAALDRPTSGTVRLDGKDLSKVKESAMAAFRRDKPGLCVPGLQPARTPSRWRTTSISPSCWPARALRRWRPAWGPSRRSWASRSC